MSSRVFVLPALKELEELLRPPLLKEAHERALKCLYLVTGDLRDLAVTVDEATSDLLELKVTRDISVDEDLSELSGSDDKLGNEVNGVVSVTSKLRRRALVWPELAIQLVTVNDFRDNIQIYECQSPTCVKFRLALSPP